MEITVKAAETQKGRESRRKPRLTFTQKPRPLSRRPAPGTTGRDSVDGAEGLSVSVRGFIVRFRRRLGGGMGPGAGPGMELNGAVQMVKIKRLGQVAVGPGCIAGRRV